MDLEVLNASVDGDAHGKVRRKQEDQELQHLKSWWKSQQGGAGIDEKSEERRV